MTDQAKENRRRSPSNTERAQQALRESLYLSEDLGELEDSNARALIRGVLLRRDIPETTYILDAVERAKRIARAEGE
ncbi:hypothetical protein AB0C70_23010 [Streptomyces sp. NPDC048564]|uniref:hypothetical protein n=1 Tax=Streptomyces sp. NPDC048564 TaxID=3155760 RepID=UPI00342C132C